MIESFETYRSYLFAIAYRMLGSAMDAEDEAGHIQTIRIVANPEKLTHV